MAARQLKGSKRSALPNARAIGPADRHERLEVRVIVRPQAQAVLDEQVSRHPQPNCERGGGVSAFFPVRSRQQGLAATAADGALAASVGWDACTGLGSPIGQQVAQVMVAADP